MAIEATSPEQTYDPGPWHTDWKDEAWRAFIASIDASLRAYYRIEEFTGDPRCVLRIGFMKAVMPVLLSDGTEIRERARLELAGLAQAGKLRMLVSQTFPLAEAAAAHRAILDGHTTGKITLIP